MKKEISPSLFWLTVHTMGGFQGGISITHMYKFSNIKIMCTSTEECCKAFMATNITTKNVNIVIIVILSHTEDNVFREIVRGKGNIIQNIHFFIYTF